MRILFVYRREQSLLDFIQLMPFLLSCGIEIITAYVAIPIYERKEVAGKKTEEFFEKNKKAFDSLIITEDIDLSNSSCPHTVFYKGVEIESLLLEN